MDDLTGRLRLLSQDGCQDRQIRFTGKGLLPAEALQISTGVVEGAATAIIASKLAAQHKVEMPIVDAVASIIDGRSNPSDEIKKLLNRPIRIENQ